MKMNCRYFLRLAALIPILFSALVTSCSRGYEGWRAGCAKVKITPEESVWMAGYASRNHPSEGVRQDLWAKALALEDASGSRAVIVTMDILSIPKIFSDNVRDELAERYGLSRAQVILNVSHTHSGPVLYGDLPHLYPLSEEEEDVVISYTDLLGEKLITLVGDALKDLGPARLSSGSGVVRFAVNRRNNIEKQLTPMSELHGPSDHSVPVLKVEDAKGNLRAVLFGYACHNTVILDYEFCGDYAGYAQQELETAYSGYTARNGVKTAAKGAQAMFFQGCGADQNPLPRRKVSLAVQYGRDLAVAVDQALESDMRPLDPVLTTRYCELDLPFDKIASDEELHELAEGDNYKARWAREMLNRKAAGETFPDKYPYPIQYWQLGDQKIFTLGGETVVEFALRFKETFGEDAFVMGYCNDVMSYIPSETVWDEGRYEGANAHFVYNLPARWQRDALPLILGAAKELTTDNEPVKRPTKPLR